MRRCGRAEEGFTPEYWVDDGNCQILRRTPDGARRSGFFLAVEQSDKLEATLKQTFQRYADRYYRGDFERLFGTRALRILFLMGSGHEIRPDRGIAQLKMLANEARATILHFAPLQKFMQGRPTHHHDRADLAETRPRRRGRLFERR